MISPDLKTLIEVYTLPYNFSTLSSRNVSAARN